jgi:hypothetical protein
MADPGQEFTLCDAVAAQPVRDDALRPVFQAMQQPFEECPDPASQRLPGGRGARRVPLWMPMLDPAVAADIEAKRLHFADARDGIVPEGRKVTPLGTFDRSRIRQWLEAMDAEFGAVRSWMP